MIYALFKGGDDYRLEQNVIRFTREMTNGCVSIDLIQDNMVENTETMLVRLTESNGLATNPQADLFTVSIEDSDSK